jgi:stage II sporulation protein D
MSFSRLLWSLIGFIAIIIFLKGAPPRSGATLNTKQIIRVLLKEGATIEPQTFHLFCEKGFEISKTPLTTHCLSLPDKTLTIILDGEKIILKRNLKTTLFNNNMIAIAPKGGKLFINETPYHGLVSFHSSKHKRYQMINWLDLESYIYAVLPSEIYQTWPPEMHMIQAIASRTYAVYYMKKAREKKQTYDVKRTNFNQVYNGTHEFDHLREAIKKTAGLVLTYEDQIALTMFDACCGGCIPAQIDYFDFSQTPYLARNYPCAYCSKFSLYRWEHTFPLTTIEEQLKKHPLTAQRMNACGSLVSITIPPESIDGAHIGHQVQLIGSTGNSTIKGAHFYEIVRSKAKSRSFSLTSDKQTVTLSGRGFGHLVGLCQHGARELVRQGWNVAQVLSFYYPHTTIAHLDSLNDLPHIKGN